MSSSQRAVCIDALDCAFLRSCAALDAAPLHTARRLARWVRRLAAEDRSAAARRNRNALAASLASDVAANELRVPFNAAPPDGPLPRLPLHAVLALHRGGASGGCSGACAALRAGASPPAGALSRVAVALIIAATAVEAGDAGAAALALLPARSSSSAETATAAAVGTELRGAPGARVGHELVVRSPRYAAKLLQSLSAAPPTSAAPAFPLSPVLPHAPTGSPGAATSSLPPPRAAAPQPQPRRHVVPPAAAAAAASPPALAPAVGLLRPYAAAPAALSPARTAERPPRHSAARVRSSLPPPPLPPPPPPPLPRGSPSGGTGDSSASSSAASLRYAPPPLSEDVAAEAAMYASDGEDAVVLLRLLLHHRPALAQPPAAAALARAEADAVERIARLVASQPPLLCGGFGGGDGGDGRTEVGAAAGQMLADGSVGISAASSPARAGQLTAADAAAAAAEAASPACGGSGGSFLGFLDLSLARSCGSDV